MARTCILSSPSLWSRSSGRLLTGSSDVFAVQALVCIYSEFRACFHCWSEQLHPESWLWAEALGCGSANWPRLPALQQYSKGNKQSHSFQSRSAGCGGLPGLDVLGTFCPCSRCAADVQPAHCGQLTQCHHLATTAGNSRLLFGSSLTQANHNWPWRQYPHPARAGVEFMGVACG